MLGAGPSGLLAVHALRLHGYRPDVLAIKRPSEIYGAMYLHEPIPYLTSDVKSQMVDYIKEGTRDGYAEKVYGHPEAPCSWDVYAGRFQAYSLQQAYQLLWIKYEHMVKDVYFGGGHMAQKITENYQVVINTIPRTMLCNLEAGHQFLSQPIVIEKALPDGMELDDNTIMYNGILEVPWYRASQIFGQSSSEYAVDSMTSPVMPSGKSLRGIKPIENDCNCNPRFHHVGRFGKWKKGVLVHHAFHDTVEIIEQEIGIDALF